MLDINILTAVIVAVGIVLFLRFGMPYLKERGYEDIYTDVKMGLLLFGYAFRDEKIKVVADLILNIVKEMEKLSIAPDEKRDKAVSSAFEALIKEFKIDIDEDAIELIVNIAVSYLPPTNI